MKAINKLFMMIKKYISEVKVNKFEDYKIIRKDSLWDIYWYEDAKSSFEF